MKRNLVSLAAMTAVCVACAAPGQEPTRPTREPLEPATLQFLWPHTDGGELPEGATLIDIGGQTYGEFTLRLPGDCPRFEEHQEFLLTSTLANQTLNTWIAADEYCAYVALLARGAEDSDFDYVSE
jgi:hypothetical protein